MCHIKGYPIRLNAARVRAASAESAENYGFRARSDHSLSNKKELTVEYNTKNLTNGHFSVLIVCDVLGE